MTDSEREFGDDIQRRLQKYHSVNWRKYPPIIDISIAHEMGFTVDEVASALAGFNKEIFDKIIIEQKRREEYNL